MISDLIAALFGDRRNLLKETVEVFKENSEAGAERAHQSRNAALIQFAAEFRPERRGFFDRAMDAINRLPRPMLALGTCGLFASAMMEPEWFAERMLALALVPEQLWWLLGGIVSFYFGARHQVKYQEFQRQIARQAQGVLSHRNARRALFDQENPREETTDQDAELTLAVLRQEENRALSDWRQKQASPEEK